MNNTSLYNFLLKPILFILMAFLLWGIFSYINMQTSLFPDVTFPKITVIADNGDSLVHKMMITVTKPLEIAIKRVNGITSVKSSTNRGSCTIDAYFDWNVDINLAKTQLNERINEIKNILPPAVNIVVEAMSQTIYPVIGFTIESDKYSQIELRNRALFNIRPQFSEVPGIANVIVRGGKTKARREVLRDGELERGLVVLSVERGPLKSKSTAPSPCRRSGGPTTSARPLFLSAPATISEAEADE